MADLFGRYCYIDTPWIAGKKTRYRIIGSGVRSNAWCEVPVTGRTELIRHDNMEEVVFVVLDTLVSDDSIIRRFSLKDVDVIPADVRPVRRGRWIVKETAYEDTEARCSKCGFTTLINEPGNGLHMLSDLNYCPGCGSYNCADMRGGDAE